MTKSRRWLITSVACLAILAGFAGYKYWQIRAAIAFGESFPEPSESVEAQTVTLTPAVTYVTTIGEIVAPRSVELRNELEGRVSEVDMVSGSRVQAGDVLLRLDASEEQARLDGAVASVRLAELNLKRLEKLLDQKTVSEDSVDRARAEFDIARANVAGLRAMIAKKTLTAPFDAVVGLHQIEIGEYLEANTPLVTLVGIDDVVWVDFSLPLGQGSAQVGDTIYVRDGSVQTDTRSAVGGPDQLTATIIAKSPSLSPESRNLGYRARLDADAAPPPNSVVNIRVPTGHGESVQVPGSAVLRDEMGAYVFILDNDDESGGYRARRQSVSLGSEGQQSVVITRGLSAGTLIATHGAFKLRQGLLVRVRDRPAQPVAVDADTPTSGG